jgi:hypothetical protein
VPASLYLSLRPRALFLSLFRSSGVPTTRPASLFRSGANHHQHHHHPNCTPDVLLPTTLALSTGSSSQLLPHFGPATLLRVLRTYPASRDSLFFRANGNRTHPSSAFPPSFSPATPFVLSLLSSRVARKLLPAFPMTCSFSRSFLPDFSFPSDPLKRRPTIAYNCDSWHNLY